jgi:hypothetical protein
MADFAGRAAPYAGCMFHTAPFRLSLRALAPAVGIALAATGAHAAPTSQSRLVHCGEQTCLRITGHRADAAVAVRIAGQDMAVEGGRSWRVTVPAQTARAWASASGSVLPITYRDARSGTERQGEVLLPPGALGRRIELATLLVSAH